MILPSPAQLIEHPRHAAPPNKLKERISTLGNNLLARVPQTFGGCQPIYVAQVNLMGMQSNP